MGGEIGMKIGTTLLKNVVFNFAMLLMYIYICVRDGQSNCRGDIQLLSYSLPLILRLMRMISGFGAILTHSVFM